MAKKIFGLVMKDACERGEGKSEKVEGETEEVKNEMHYPCISSYGVEIPGIKDLEVGKKYVIVGVVKLSEKRETEDGEFNGELKLMECGFKAYEKKSEVEMNEEEVDEALKNGTVEEE